jgi:hypothetical protein
MVLGADKLISVGTPKRSEVRCDRCSQLGGVASSKLGFLRFVRKVYQLSQALDLITHVSRQK